MPRRDDLQQDHGDRLGSDRDRPGVRVRLLGHAGVQGAAARGLRGRAGELEPRHDHDRPAVRGPHLHRAARRPTSVLPILERERPDALLPTIGGQTALNVAVALAESGDLDRLGDRADRRLARGDPPGRGPERLQGGDGQGRASTCRARASRTPSRRRSALGDSIGYPLIVRASFTLGGGGSGFADDPAGAGDARRARRSRSRPVTEILVEESIAGWKEFELEVMRDADDNGVIICSIENVDPMGVHTGDSITVAPQQTLTDREYQQMRDAALQVLRVIGVETGGSNVQFAVDPDDRPAGADRDEPARLALERPRLEGHRVPDREDRGAARGRVPARRDHERHHRRDARRRSSPRSTTSS